MCLAPQRREKALGSRDERPVRSATGKRPGGLRLARDAFLVSGIPLLLAAGSLAARGLHFLMFGEWRSITALQCLTEGCDIDGRPFPIPPRGLVLQWLRDPHSWIGLHKLLSWGACGQSNLVVDSGRLCRRLGRH